MKHLSFWRRLILSWRALRDPRTPLPAKIIAAIAILYAASPIDLLPDVIPFVGWTDDLLILVTALMTFLRLATKAIELLDREEKNDGVIDVEARERRKA
jgi:uncharacterized membrane protein YkvA (DUF1232 family)